MQMPTFAVRFKGMINKLERERLEAADIEIKGSEPSMQIGIIKTGVPIYTVHVEADSEKEALQTVRAVMEPDTANFSNWESGPA
jgi:translation initiation factor 2 alpha subunit (eIF-2alpha)